MKRLLTIFLFAPLFAFAQTNKFVVPGTLQVKILPNTAAAGDSILTSDVNGNVKKSLPYNSGVQSVSGTANRVTSTGGINPVIDISANYVGQSSITTLGTITSGTWQGTPIAYNFLGLTFNNGLTNTTGTIQLGGNLTVNTTIPTSGFSLTLGTTDQLVQFGITNHTIQLSNSNSFYTTTIDNNVNNSANAFEIKNGNMTLLKSAWRAYSSIDLGNPNSCITNLYGSINATGTAFSNYTQLGIGTFINQMLFPSANNDVLVGNEVKPTFTTGLPIGTFDNLIGGTGYTDGTYTNIALVEPNTQGTFVQSNATIVVSGGIVTSVTITRGGSNHFVGEILTALSGIGSGSGFQIRVASLGAYTGLTNYAQRTWGLDVYDSDYSSSYTPQTKVDKEYSDTHISGISLSDTTTAPIIAPKMTTTQKNAISSPVEGMVVYDTTLHEYDYYNGSVWGHL